MKQGLVSRSYSIPLQHLHESYDQPVGVAVIFKSMTYGTAKSVHYSNSVLVSDSILGDSLPHIAECLFSFNKVDGFALLSGMVK